MSPSREARKKRKSLRGNEQFQSSHKEDLRTRATENQEDRLSLNPI